MKICNETLSYMKIPKYKGEKFIILIKLKAYKVPQPHKSALILMMYFEMFILDKPKTTIPFYENQLKFLLKKFFIIFGLVAW